MSEIDKLKDVIDSIVSIQHDDHALIDAQQMIGEWEISGWIDDICTNEREKGLAFIDSAREQGVEHEKSLLVAVDAIWAGAHDAIQALAIDYATEYDLEPYDVHELIKKLMRAKIA
ncbi:hypothetical protein AVI51_06110 [Piscirickettsia salmonis]|uniref:Uncharacterized protein n=1 Tax=Piscirickettsia salmonis TaxID=1238 RepID=A0A9Q5VL50_PISSA|nr:hypothetical protein [Piscirickettsia salmonis]ALA25665.1 excinuclease ABC subunit A [Piscirickettsia salmonis]APS43157.1 hypothetical protein AVI48_01330 [Piscirickettsia salmonis]APS46505.1 hypothetical protein AVI49_01930 [Piscirickettsia salmonis]APS50475.1 hypothetical protein AVI50_06175 [Piscirickettsia salmonis]APS53678.1 hypothetical protein AVI51_06110 [Piscirickettsia salmonis]